MSFAKEFVILRWEIKRWDCTVRGAESKRAASVVVPTAPRYEEKDKLWQLADINAFDRNRIGKLADERYVPNSPGRLPQWISIVGIYTMTKIVVSAPLI